MATERIGKAVLDLNLDAAGLLAGLEKVRGSSRQTDNEFEKLRQKSRQAGQDLAKMVEGFRGDAIVAEARRTAQAVEQGGGVSKLTKKELADVAATVAQATDKLKRMGAEVPPSISRLSTELARVDAESRKGSGGLTSLRGAAAALGPILPVASLAGAATAIFSVGKNAIASAGELMDLKDQTGLSTDTLQEMKAVAAETGVELSALTDNAYKLGLNVSQGTKKAKDAAAELGIEWKALSAASPDERFRMVVTALEGVDNQTERNRLGTALFGKSFKEIAQSVEAGYTNIAATATKSSEAQIAALDRAGEAWDRFVAAAGANTRSTLGGVVQYFEDTLAAVTLQIDKYSSLQQQRIRELQGQGGEGLADLLAQFDKPRTDINLPGPKAAEDYIAALKAAQVEVANLSAAQRNQLNAALKLGGDAAEEYAQSIGLSDVALRLYSGAAKEGAKATNELADLQKSLFNDEAIAKGHLYAQALGDVSNLSGLTADKKAELRAAVVDAIAAYESLGRVAPKSLTDIEAATRPLLESTREWGRSALPAAVESMAERLKRAGSGDSMDFPTGTLAETAAATAEADAAMQAWANTTGGAYPAAVRQASAATDEFTESTYDAYSTLAQMFSQLGQVQGGLGGFMQAAGNIVVQLQGAREQAKLMGGDGQMLGGKFGALSTVFNKNATSSQKLAAGLASAAGVASGAVSIWNATGQSASKAKNAMSGALAGAQAGAMFGPWGMAVGAAAGLVVGVLRGKPAWAKAAQEVGRDFGTSISKELGQKIADLAKKEFKGSRQVAAVASIGDIIKEAGGLNPENLDRFTGKLRDVFALVEGGQMNAAQATKVLDENWAQFVAAGTDGQGRLSSGLKEIIRLQQRMGIESQQITAYLKEQADVIAQGVNLAIAASQTQIDKWIEVAAAAKAAAEAKRAADAAGQGSPEIDKALADANAALAAQRATAAQYKLELDDLALIALASYQAARAAGKTHAEAMAAAGPGLAQLKAAYDALGISIDDAATKSLMVQATIQQQNPTLIAGVAGLTQSMIALDNSGRMNAETFAAMQRRAMDMFTRLQAAAAAAGADMSTNAEALLPMQEYLREAARQAKLLGIPLDANTQMLIDQSKELGIWEDEGEEAGETMQDVMEGIRDAVLDLGRAMRGLPSQIDINVNRNYTNTGDPAQDPGFSEGIFRGQFSSRGTRAILHDVESVVPRDKELAFADRVYAEAGRGAVTTNNNSTSVLPIVMGNGLAPSEIGRRAAAYLAQSGLGTNVEGIRVAVEKVVEQYLVSYGAEYGAR